MIRRPPRSTLFPYTTLFRSIDVGELPTPALYFATHTLRVDGGIQVTGSHNPPEFNGIKMVLGAEPVYGGGIQRLREHIESGRLFAIPGGTRESDESILPRYREAESIRRTRACRRGSRRGVRIR